MATATPRLRRSESFWGLHFDLHPGENDTALGRDLTEEMVANLLERTRPDYVQYDCKGHAGWTGYPTRVGWPSPGIVQDSLAIWRKVTRDHGVALYIHYSGVWDGVAVRHRPEWARVGPDYLADAQMTSTYGAYVDELLIPQLKELVDTYDLDGAWVDGECWAVRLDYSPRAAEAFRAATGLSQLPKRRGEPGWEAMVALQRRRFEEYVTYYANALHAHAPAFQITSNWMYSAHMPQPVQAPLDYLSGDYTPGEAVNSARLEARRFAAVRQAQGLSWDLMAWGFNYDPQARGERSLKPAIQLQQEASIVLGQGGGYQIYFKPTRAGWIDVATVDVAAEVGAFCRDRQAVSHITETVPQVALLFSETTHYDRLDDTGTLFSRRPIRPMEGALHALLELGYSVDLLTEEQLAGPSSRNGSQERDTDASRLEGVPLEEPPSTAGERVDQYPVVVVPECHVLAPETVERLTHYARVGGSVLLLGAQTAGLFRETLGVTFHGEPGDAPASNVRATLPGKTPMLAWTGGPWQAVTLPDNADGIQGVGRRYPQFELRGDGEIASTVTRTGEGQIGAAYGPLATAHHHFHHPVTRAFIGELMRVLFPEPAARLDGPSSVDLSLRRKDGQTLAHLCNVTGMQVAPRYVCLDEVPPVGPLTLHLHLDRRPERIETVPEIPGFTWEWDEATSSVRAVLPTLEIHSVLVCEGAGVPGRKG